MSNARRFFAASRTAASAVEGREVERRHRVALVSAAERAVEELFQAPDLAAANQTSHAGRQTGIVNNKSGSNFEFVQLAAHFSNHSENSPRLCKLLCHGNNTGQIWHLQD